jgi:predicted nucleotide-binding protein
MLYHVNITLEGGGREIKLGYTEEQLRERVLGPYEMGRPFTVNGKTIKPDEIDKIRISRGEMSVEDLLAKGEEDAQRKGIIGLDDYFAWCSCEEVTDDLILGPPGYKARPAEDVQLRAGRGDKLRVFVVHGRDQGLAGAVGRFVEAVGLKPVMLHEQPDHGRTVIEQFGRESDVGFAVALWTGDDLGESQGALGTVGPAVEKESQSRRAPEDVIFELGYFLGRLGRPRVAIIMDEGVEMPSDLHGIIYIRRADWKSGLYRALTDAGYRISQEQSRKALAVRE